MAKFIKSFFDAVEKIGKARADAELRRMGYTPEKLEKMTNRNLENWV